MSLKDSKMKWKITLLSGVSALNDVIYEVEGTAEEASSNALGRLVQDAEGDSPEYHGFSVQHKF